MREVMRCVTLRVLVYTHYVFEEEGAKCSIVVHMACNLPPVHRSWVPITDSGGFMTVTLQDGNVTKLGLSNRAA